MNKRIEFIDLAKGICITLVVIGHCGVSIPIPGWEIVRMPLYFILSGLFFKDYGGLANFAIRKTNKILIPFLFFYLVGCLGFYLIKYLTPSLLITDARGILDMFNNRQFFNGPIWFLLCLFWCNLIFCIISLKVRKESIRILLTCIIGGIGCFLGNQHIFIPLFIDVAFTALPFFVFGYYLKKTEILYPNKYDKYNILIAVFFYLISVYLSQNTTYRLSLHYNGLEGWSTYLLGITSVLSILFLCKIIKRVWLISYMGRYSIILLCTHHLIYRPIAVLQSNIMGEKNVYLVAIITLAISCLLIPLCIKYIPYFVAQKDLIKAKK